MGRRSAWLLMSPCHTRRGTTKARFTSQEAVEAEARRLKQAAYKCGWCDGWHLTSRKKRGRH
jgi:hypothetical protein